jgi:hypothetical protein
MACAVMAPVCAGGGRASRNISAMTLTPTRTDAPAYAAVIDTDAMSAPPSAGPSANASACDVDAKVTARGKCSRGTSAGKSAARAGFVNEPIDDTVAAHANSPQGVITSKNDSRASAAIASSATICPPWITRRRS